MEADQGRRLAWIEVAEDGVADLPVEFLERLGLRMDRSGGGAGPKGTVFRFLHNEKNFLHGSLQWNQSGSGRQLAAAVACADAGAAGPRLGGTGGIGLVVLLLEALPAAELIFLRTTGRPQWRSFLASLSSRSSCCGRSGDGMKPKRV